MPGPYLAAQRWVALGKETIRGTPVAASIYIPVGPNPALTPNQTWATDDGLRGSPIDTYGDVALNFSSGFSHRGNVFCDTFPNLMEALLGGTDTVTGTAAPFSHSIPLLNAATTGSQPPSYTIFDVDLIEEPTNTCKQMADGQLSQLDVDFAATGALNYTATWIGNAYTQVAAPTPSWSTEIFVPAYNGIISFGGSQSFVVTQGTLSMKRSAAPIFTIGQQSSYRNWAGPFNVTGSLTFVALAGDNTMTAGTTTLKQVASIAFTDPVSGHTVTFHMNQVQFKDPKVSSDQPYITVTCNFSAQGNSVDASSGFSPLKFTATSAQSTPY